MSGSKSIRVRMPAEVVTRLEQLGVGRLEKVTHYLQNSAR